MLRQVWFIAKHDTAYMLRQWETILWVFIMPAIFFYFIGTVTGGFGRPAGSAAAPDLLLLKAPAAGGVVVEEITRRLKEQKFAVRPPSTDKEWAAARRRLIVPDPAPGFETLTAMVLAGKQAVVRFERSGDDPAARFDQVRVARAIYGVVADLAVLRGQDQMPGAESFARLRAEPRTIGLTVESAGVRVRPPSGFAQAIPGTMVMFTMMVLLTSGAIMLVVERRQGLLRRLASTPIPRGAVVLGKWAGKMALGLVQIAVALAIGTLFFRMEWGSSLPMIGLVLGAWASFNASLGLMLGNLTRSEGQTAGLGVLTTMALAALGGCWWPIEIAPSWMQTLARFLPTGWAMDAMHRLVNFGYGPLSALPHLAALIVSALVLGWAGIRTFRYQ